LGVLLEKKGETVNPKRLFRVYNRRGVRRRERKWLERGVAMMPLFRAAQSVMVDGLRLRRIG
jgi:hypothetical protein